MNLVAPRIYIEIAVARAEAAVAAHHGVRVENAGQRGEEHAVTHGSAMAVGSMPCFEPRGGGGGARWGGRGRHMFWVSIQYLFFVLARDRNTENKPPRYTMRVR